MKPVFNNRQLAHVWAQQTQESGRNSNNTMYFSGPVMYSYGRHYAMANITKQTVYLDPITKGRSRILVLINENSYSNTTVKQKYDVKRALDSTKFHQLDVPKVLDLYSQDNETYLFNNVVDHISSMMSLRTKYVSFVGLDDGIKELNIYLQAVNKPEFKLDALLYSTLISVNIDREKRQKELDVINTEKNRIKVIERQQLDEANKIKYASYVAQWLDGAIIPSMPYNAWPSGFELIRIKPSDNTLVESNRGAEVPINEARQLLQAFLNGQAKIGDKVGHFTVDELPNNENIVKIGCHKVSLDQAKQALNLTEGK